MGEWLAATGLTPALVITALFTPLATIVAAYVSARLGVAAESRRQYEEKAKIDKRQAAADLIHPLLAFAFQCDRCVSEIEFANSAATSANRLRVLEGLQLSADCNRHAAVLGGEVVAPVL